MDRRTKLFAKQHDASERRLADVTIGFFDDQLRRVIEQLRDFSHPTPAIVPQIFQADDEHATFLKLVRPHILASMGIGALSQLELLQPSKAFTDEDVTDEDGNVLFDWDDIASESVQADIAAALELSMNQPYWKFIQITTERKLTDTITQAISDGINPAQMAKRIQETMGGISRARGLAIARTETTNAMNAGHESAYIELAASGSLKAREWNAILDKDLRPANRKVHGDVADAGEPFLLEGHEAMWPAHPDLPGYLRINCRCTTLGILNV